MLHSDLYPFQKVGAAFAVAGQQVLLAHEMGLGKSPMTVAAVRHMHEIGMSPLPALVVCTNSMKRKWQEEFEKWWPGITTVVVGGSATKRRAAIAERPGVTIINWESLRAHSRLAGYGSIHLSDKEKQPGELNAQGYRTVIADEAHRGADPKAKQTRAWWHLSHDAAYRFALTGTPIVSSPEDLWSLLHALSPEEWPSRTKYISRYTIASLNHWGSLEVLGLRTETRSEFETLIAHRFIRATKAEVLPDLPAKVRTTRAVEMGTKQAKAYKDFATHALALFDSGLLHAEDPLVRLGRLRQIAAALPVLDAEGNVVSLAEPSCKVDGLLEVLDEAPGEPLVVFAESRKLIELCAEVLTRKKISHVQITGAVQPAQRAFNVEQFQAGEAQVCLCTVGAGGEGITLTRASRALFLQRPWSLVQSSQAEDRIHRIGQEATSVEIIDLVTAGTVEEAVLGVLDGKADLLDEITRDRQRLAAFLQGSAA